MGVRKCGSSGSSSSPLRSHNKKSQNSLPNSSRMNLVQTNASISMKRSQESIAEDECEFSTRSKRSRTTVEDSSRLDDDQGERLTPYPFHQRSQQEIEDFQYIQEVLSGEEWSLNFADEVSEDDNSMSEDSEVELYTSTSKKSERATQHQYACSLNAEEEERKGKMTELWRQSLKRSLFQNE